MRRMVTLALVALIVVGQAGVPALPPGEWIVDDQHAGAVAGQVVDPTTEAPVVGATVRLSRPAQASDRSWPEPWVVESADEDTQIASVTTDADGRFRFRGLRPGLYRVRVRGALRRTASAEAYITVESPRAEVALRVEPGAVLSGLVTDPDGNPIANFPVALVGLDLGDGRNRIPADRWYGVRTDDEGGFVLGGVPTGQVHLQAMARRYGYSEHAILDVRSGDVVEELVLVVPDERDQLAQAGEKKGGIGVRLDWGPEGPRIAHLFEGMAAAEAGLRIGDLVTALNGRDTRFMWRGEFIARCTGTIGEEVAVGVERDGERFVVRLTRRAFPDG